MDYFRGPRGDCGSKVGCIQTNQSWELGSIFRENSPQMPYLKVISMFGLARTSPFLITSSLGLFTRALGQFAIISCPSRCPRLVGVVMFGGDGVCR